MKRLAFALILGLLAGSASATETWREPNLAYRQAFNVTKAGASVTGFPVAIVLNATYFKVAKAKMATGCWEVWDSDGVHWYGEEVSLTDDGTYITAELHVSDSTYDMSSGKELWLYYGTKASASSRVGTTGSANGKAVWDANYMAVWHLGEASGNIADSTGINAGTKSGSPTYGATGAIGSAITFDGKGSLFNCGTNNALNLTSSLTVSAWVSTKATKQTDIIARFLGYSPYAGWAFALSSNSPGRMAVWSSGIGSYKNATDACNSGSWTHVAVTGTGTAGVHYLSGASNGTFTYASPGSNSGGTCYLGCNFDGSSNVWDGSLDEVRVSNAARSADWLTAENANGVAGNGLTLDGSEESPPAGGGIIRQIMHFLRLMRH